jgi:hypothetical protein
VYHLELRKFPHTACRFNQSEAQIRAIVVPWARQEWIEEGERSWNINEATLTILEGPQLSMPELAMGRGWRNAQKRSQDVTERVLEAARAIGAQGGAPVVAAPRPAEDAGVSAFDDATLPAPVAAQGGGQGAQVRGSRDAGGRDMDGGGDAEMRLLADSLGLELLAALDQGPLTPLQAWRVARERLQAQGRGDVAADSLALATLAVGSLLQRGLAVLRRDGASEQVVAAAEQETLLAAIDTWVLDAHQQVLIARKI